MFNETSYPTGLGDAAAVQRRLDAGKRVKQAKLDRFGLTAPALPSTNPGGPAYGAPSVRRPIVSGDPGAGVMVDPLMPGTDSSGGDASAEDSGGGFDLGGIFSALPWWVWAIGAYMLLKKR